MIASERDGLARLLEPHLQAARDRDPHINMLITSPPDSPPSSSDDELEWEGDKGGGGRSAPAFAKRPHTASMRMPAHQGPMHANPDRDRKRRVVFSEGSEDFEFDYEATGGCGGGGSSSSSSSAQVSGLTTLLKAAGCAGNADSDGRGPTAAAIDAGPPIKIRVFGAPMSGGVINLEVTKTATFAQVIARTLARASGGGAQAGAMQTGAYELLMADDEGDADDDFPPPPRDTKISDFGTDFRLRPAPPAVAKKLLAEAAAAAAAEAEEASKAAPSARGMRVHLPREAFGQRLEQWVITQPYREEILLADLMREVCRKRGVRLHPAKHVFTLPHSDKPLDMGLRLGAIELPKNAAGFPEVAVAPRTYADAPPRLKRVGGLTHAVGGAVKPSAKFDDDHYATAGAGGAAVDKEGSRAIDFVFSDVTAAQYKEYQVTKVNKRGVRQERVIGIDRDRFYNLAHSREDVGPSSFRDWGLKAVGLRQVDGGTKHPFRPMRDALDARIVEGEPRTIEVIFKDVSEGVKGRKTQTYEGKTPREAAEIVAKLSYLMLLQGGSRTQRLADTDDLGPPPATPARGGINPMVPGAFQGLANRRLSG